MTTHENYLGWVNRESWETYNQITSDEDLLKFYEGALSGLSFYSAVPVVKQLTEDLCDPQSYEFVFGAPWPDEFRDMSLSIGSLWRVDWEAVTAGLVVPPLCPNCEQIMDGPCDPECYAEQEEKANVS